MKISTRFLLFFFGLMLFCFPAFAHVIPYDLKHMSAGATGFMYFKLGFTHILPFGYDHVLFILGLFLLNPKLKTVLTQATVFTVAHSLTLGFAMTGKIHPLPSYIEPLIAMSIVFVGIENIIVKDVRWWRIIIVFLFGLIHGCGFAGALAEIGMPQKDFFTALISFNIGVEAGQVTLIFIAYFLIGKWFSEKQWYRSRIVIPLSICIAMIAAYWTIERILA